MQPDGQTCWVLPRQHAQAGSPWLLKMHGDVAAPGERRAHQGALPGLRRRALAVTGMVQSLLMTRHMLFVGFSLVDDNFARLAHQVRRVGATGAGGAEDRDGPFPPRGHRTRPPLGSDLDQVCFGPEDNADGRVSDLVAARKLKIFLDRVGWRARRARGGSEAYLLDGATRRGPAAGGGRAA